MQHNPPNNGRHQTGPVGPVGELTERACNDPQRMKARKTEAKIIEMMPARAWLSCTAVSRLIGAPDDGKTRARLDRLVRDSKFERKREQGTHGPVYLFRSFREQRPAGLP